MEGGRRSQLRSLIGSVRDMVALRSSVACPIASTSDPTDNHASKMESLKQQYSQAREALAQSLQDMDEEGTSEAVPMVEGEDGISLARYTELKEQVQVQNETIKMLMDLSRHLLESMSMWEAHKRKLDQHQQATQR